MRALAIVTVAGLFAAVAAADFVSSLPSAPGSGNGSTTRVDEYQLDDGVSENSVGLTAGGTFLWFNQFNVQAGLDQITGISNSWGSASFPGSAGVSPGTPFTVSIWTDNNGNATPVDSGATLVAQANGVVQAGAIDTDAFQTTAIAANLTGVSSFYVGVTISHAAGTFPAALDQTLPQGRSWVAIDPVGNLNGSLNLVDVGLAGNWLLRANAVPEPASLSLLALAALGLLRRR